MRSPGASDETPGTCLLFRHGKTPFDITLNLPSTPKIDRLIAVGLPGDIAVSVDWNGSTLRLYPNTAGALRTSDQGVLVVQRP